jgi:hypothetical protein
LGQAALIVVEIWAAIVGAGVAIGASGIGSFMKRDDEASRAVIRLTAAVEHIAGEVSLLRGEIKEDRQELYPRLNAIEQRLAKLEGRL